MGTLDEFDPWSYERKARELGYSQVAGVDEAGRGPLAGPVIAAAVILPHDFDITGIRDSKKLSPLQREKAFERIIKEAVGLAVGVCDSKLIDEINILQATYTAMRGAIALIKPKVDYVLVDGYPIRSLNIPQEGIFRGDSLSVSIAAASIIAKVTRDRMMCEFDAKYPGYGFAKHKGYYTAEHITAIAELGICEIHRRSFEPIASEVERECRQRSLF
ncbi:MAG: ribonuclease HII [Armatimonadota bacterium]|nr:ribonuclease HII [Armatimonadota bacterium]